MTTRLFILMLIAMVAYPFCSASAEDVASERHESVPLPVAEVAYKVTQWLQRSGTTVHQSILKNGKVTIRGTGKDDDMITSWLIELTPQSSLGTELFIKLEGDETADEIISLFIEQFEPLNTENDSFALGGNNVIPEAILNQIDNVACIHAQSKTRSVQFTGFFIDKNGLILSTAHDLLEHEHVSIISNTGIPYEGDVIKADFTKDLALIKVNATKDDIVSITEGRNLLGMGETVFLIGCPINLRGTIHKGFVNGPPRKVNDVPLWQVQMKIQQGSSGSPVFDSTGAFVAIVKGRHREAKDIGFLIPLEVVVDFLKDYFSS